MATKTTKTGKATKAAKSMASTVPPGTLIVIEGDSWEKLPDLGPIELPMVGGAGYDIGRGLADLGFRVLNLARWGDKLAEIVEAQEYRKVLLSSKARYFLLGGGGNDLLDDGRLASFIRLYGSATEPRDYIKPQFGLALDRIISDYETAIADVIEEPALADVRIIVHGYDYARPVGLRWLGEPFTRMGFDNGPETLPPKIVAEMIDEFNRRLKKLEKKYPAVIHVDLRGTVAGRWHDELHPTKAAFADLAGAVAAKVLTKSSPTASPAAVPAPSLPVPKPAPAAPESTPAPEQPDLIAEAKSAKPKTA